MRRLSLENIYFVQSARSQFSNLKTKKILGKNIAPNVVEFLKKISTKITTVQNLANPCREPIRRDLLISAINRYKRLSQKGFKNVR